MNKIGIYGGTFNPVHNGHVRAVQAFIKAIKPDFVLVIPTSIPPHKIYRGLVKPSDRLEMLRLAFIEMPKVIIDDFEINKGGKSYTVDTVLHYKENYPQAEIWLLIGTDMLYTVQDWYRAAEILRNVHIAAISRYQNENTEKFAEQCEMLKENYSVDVTVIPNEPFEISSHEVCLKIENGEDVLDYLPKWVFEYINNNQLYQT